MIKNSNFEPGWDEVLKDILRTDSFLTLQNFVSDEYSNKKIFPEYDSIFKAFELTPFSQVKVVIVGQDPYHDEGQACGLCFSVPLGIQVPPSLKNIYKEIETDCGVIKDMKDGNLESWAKQGVFLLNAILTVEAHMPASHKGKGWEEFTDAVIKTISDKQEHVVFMLWGNYARGKKELIDANKHLVLEAAHPSPFSAYSGFFQCHHFSFCNAYLKEHKKLEIHW